LGQEYRLQISLPAGYRNSDQRFPVVYLLDAQWDFPLMCALSGQQYYDGFVPGLIIVGVTWGGENPDPDALRLRDFTPTDPSGNGASGGAAKFLSFFEQELIPFVDQHYRTTGDRTLIGSSLGGLFTLYALFNRPDLFNGYIATSPATPWDSETIYRFEEGFPQRSASSPSRLFIAVGELEDLYQPVMKLVSTLRLRDFPGLTWTSHVVKGAGHSGVKADGDTRGLQFVFQRADLALAADELRPYLGTYQSTSGPTAIQVGIEDGKLRAQLADGSQSWILSAQDQTHFYYEGSFLNVSMILGEGGLATGFTAETYGKTEAFRKVND